MGKGTSGILQGPGDEPIGSVERDSFLVKREQAKYEKVWKDARYRQSSPGERTILRAMGMGMKKGDSLIDFGCGCGRPLKAFQQLGLDVLGLDLAENCLDRDLDLPFRHTCLWNLPPLKADWGYCTDVMEHIPEEKVDDVLEGIRKSTTKGAFFQIAMRPDSSGMLIIGEQLHLTVKGVDWWKAKLKKHWQEVEVEEFSTWCVAQCR